LGYFHQFLMKFAFRLSCFPGPFTKALHLKQIA
jgi:hypothetical protein